MPKMMKHLLSGLQVAALFMVLSPLFPQNSWGAPSLTVGAGSGQAGTSVSIPVTFDPTTNTVGGIQFSITLPAGVSTGTITAGAAATNANKSISANRTGNTWVFIVFGLNQTPIAAGTLLTAQFHIAPGTPVGTLPLSLSGVVYADPNGISVVPGTNTSGSIAVVLPVPVITSTGIVSGTVGTAFAYQITATNSPTSFNATGLPAGLSINTTTGLISGTPTSAATSNITLSATHAGGTGTKILTLTVLSPCDVNSDRATNVADVQLEVLMAIFLSPCTRDINQDSVCNVIDVQRVVLAALGGACSVAP